MIDGIRKPGEKYRSVGYVKLAKLWERDRDKIVEALDNMYRRAFISSPTIKLDEVYIDITGASHIYARKEMIRLLRDCGRGDIDVIVSQTQAYLAPNALEFFYLMQFIMTLPHQVEIITDADSSEFMINTIAEGRMQRGVLYKMSSDVIAQNPADFAAWKDKIMTAIKRLNEEDRKREEEIAETSETVIQ